MKWLTKPALLQQVPEPNKWLMAENELYQDNDGCIYLVPRMYKTDNYTIPDWIAWLGGSKSKWDARPAHIHDFGCQYHQLLKVTISESELRRLRYLEPHKGYWRCKDIPTEYLSLVPVKKWEIDCLFKRAMKATKTIPAFIYNLYRGGVFFNFGWLGKHPPFDMDKIYTIAQNERQESDALFYRCGCEIIERKR